MLQSTITTLSRHFWKTKVIWALEWQTWTFVIFLTCQPFYWLPTFWGRNDSTKNSFIGLDRFGQLSWLNVSDKLTLVYRVNNIFLLLPCLPWLVRDYPGVTESMFLCYLSTIYNRAKRSDLSSLPMISLWLNVWLSGTFVLRLRQFLSSRNKKNVSTCTNISKCSSNMFLLLLTVTLKSTYDHIPVSLWIRQLFSPRIQPSKVNGRRRMWTFLFLCNIFFKFRYDKIEALWWNIAWT